MKKFTVFLLILITLLTAAVSAEAPANTFADVTAGHWAFDEIQFFYNAGIVAGIGDNYFAPDDNVTREQFAKLLAMLYSKTGYTSDARTFSDVTPEMWSYNYIEAVKEYLTGYYPSGAQPFFNPAAKASREDVAYSLVKIIGLSNTPKDENSINKFSDAGDISPNLKGGVGAAVENGLIRGYEDGTFKPLIGITRAETVELLFRALNIAANNDETPNPTTIPELTVSPVPTVSPSLTVSPKPNAAPTTVILTPPKPLASYKYNITLRDIEKFGSAAQTVKFTEAGRNIEFPYWKNLEIAIGWTPENNEAYFLLKCNLFYEIGDNLTPVYGDYTAFLDGVSYCDGYKITGTLKVVQICGDEVLSGTDQYIMEISNGKISASSAAFHYKPFVNNGNFFTANLSQVYPGDGYNWTETPDWFGLEPNPTPTPEPAAVPSPTPTPGETADRYFAVSGTLSIKDPNDAEGVQSGRVASVNDIAVGSGNKLALSVNISESVGYKVMLVSTDTAFTGNTGFKGNFLIQKDITTRERVSENGHIIIDGIQYKVNTASERVYVNGSAVIEKRPPGDNSTSPYTHFLTIRSDDNKWEITGYLYEKTA